MLKKTMDKLIALHFKSASSPRSLAHLESDVWQKISAIKADQSLSWQEKMFLAFGVKEFRMGSIALALILGLGVGGIMPQEQADILSKSREMGLHVFASNIEYLPSTLIEGK
jgi:hypothetical protein